MIDRFTAMRVHEIGLDLSKDLGVLDFSRHSTGIGGVHPMPVPAPVVAGLERLRFPLIRIFLQEFFFIYNGDGSFNWSILDPFMDAVHATGAKIMASICIKPAALYPAVDETIWAPGEADKWRHVIRELVKRYSVERDYVTHWSIGNETNIGEWGGCPYRIDSPDDYFEYYKLTVKPILEAASHVKVGGPSYAGVQGAAGYIGRFIALCKEHGQPLDFVSYNMYSDHPAQWADGAAQIKAAAEAYGKNIEVYVTELNIGIGEAISVEEKAYDPKRAAALAAILLALHDGGALAGTFQYHAYDQYCDPRLFAPFYARCRYMAEHWNDMPHRLGLFDANGAPRPQYDLYAMLKSLARSRFAVDVKSDGLHVAASRDGNDRITVFAANYAASGAADAVLQFTAKDMPEGVYRMMVTRIDRDAKRNGLDLVPTEDRVTYVHPDFRFAVFSPADSVLLIQFRKEG